MTPSLEQFKALLAAAETGSFSAAARRLGKAQSVVSTAIANLEIDLGLELFDRSGRYPVLTEAGARISQEAGVLLAQSERLQAIAGELASGIESRLTLAFTQQAQHAVSLLLILLGHTFPYVEWEQARSFCPVLFTASISGASLIERPASRARTGCYLPLCPV